MPSSDDPADDDGFVPPLPPEDRLWRHPSELAAHGGPRAPEPRRAVPSPDGHRPGRRRTAATVLVSAATGMLLTVMVLATVGALDGETHRVVIERYAVDDGDAPVAERLGPAIARLELHTPEGRRSATAVAYRSDGHLLTTEAAVADATRVTVTLADGRVVEGRLVGADATSGVAVVAVDLTSLPTAVLGTDDAAAVGEPALAVAHGPGAGADPTVGPGQVSGTGWWAHHDQGTYHGVIRTVLSPGAPTSGVLTDESGTVLGLLLAHADAPAATGERPGGSALGASVTIDEGSTGFAVPIDYAVRIADQLVAEGRAQHPWMGAHSEDLDATQAAELGRSGARLTDLADSGPADRAGLVDGDVVVAVGTTPVGSHSALVVALRGHRPGDVAALRYLRDGQSHTAMVRLGEAP